MSVFAPLPVLTVTIEPGAEHPEIHVHPGGQGTWIANMLVVLGTSTVLCTTFGGETGRVLESVLRRDLLEVRGLPTERGNASVVEDRRSGQLESLAVMPAPPLNRHEADELCNTVLTAGLETGVTVLSGPATHSPVDADLYRRLAAALTRLGVIVVADLSGDPLCAALSGGVTVLKVSDEDLGADDPVEAVESMRSQADAIVLSRGPEPALLFAEELFEVRVPRMEAVNHRGAGDAMTAGIAAGLGRGYPLTEAVRLGAAAGAVNVTRYGLASGRRDTIEMVAEQVTIQRATEQEVRRARTHHQ